jgi:hypothetical protein
MIYCIVSDFKPFWNRIFLRSKCRVTLLWPPMHPTEMSHTIEIALMRVLKNVIPVVLQQ